MHSGDQSASSPGADPNLNEITVLDSLIVIAKHKWLILKSIFVGFLLSVTVSFLLPEIYLGRAVLLPPSNQQSVSAALLSQLAGTLPGGLSVNALTKNPSDIYVGMLNSRTIADRVIARFDLQTVYERDTLVDTRKELADRSSTMRATPMALITSGMRTLCALLAMLFASSIALAGGPTTSGSMKDGP